MTVFYIRVLFIYLFFFIFNKQDKTVDCILVWNKEYSLEWSDFQGKKPDKNIGLKKAETTTDITIKASYIKGEIPNFIVINTFIKNESWTITDSKEVLEHERLHFDISELYTRKIRERFKKLYDTNEKDSQIYIDEYYKYRNLEGICQDKYDSEVYFNEVRQQKWIDSIGIELNKLKEYEYVPEK